MATKGNEKNTSREEEKVKPKCEVEYTNGSWWAIAPDGYEFYTMEGKTQPHILLQEADE